MMIFYQKNRFLYQSDTWSRNDMRYETPQGGQTAGADKTLRVTEPSFGRLYAEKRTVGRAVDGGLVRAAQDFRYAEIRPDYANP
jgi:hypothetical protein